jgi:hypothetical protein
MEASMKHLSGRSLTAVVAAALALLAPAASAETYQAKPNPPCIPSPLPSQLGRCWTPIPSPAGWKCHWSMDLKGKELKSLLVNSGGTHTDATDCDLRACTSACAQTEGCIAVDIVKSSKIDGQWNSAGQCICTLFGSVTSTTKFEEIVAPVDKILSGWACMKQPKSPPPPIVENPTFPGIERPGVERDQFRPDAPGTPGTHRVRP